MVVRSPRCSVLVVESQALGSIGAIRSLGRAGYRVHAAARTPDALGLKSKYASAAVLHPSYKHVDEFVGWLRDYVKRHDVRVIVPSEGLLVAIRGCFQEFAPLIPFGPTAETVYRGLSKYDLFRCLLSSSDAGRHVPSTRLVDDTASGVLPDLEELRLPVFVKADAVYSRDGSESCTRRCETYHAARATLEELAPSFEKLVVQEYVPGVGVGAFFLCWQGTVYAEFMHRRLHEVPHTGGASSFRRSWFDRDVQEDALLKLKTLGWQGVGMFEYRWDPTTREFFLMELNGRFWGSLHLAMYAGVDFPAMLVACHLGDRPEPARTWKDVSCRHIVRDLEYVLSILKDGDVSGSRKLRAVGEFVWLGFDPTIRADLLYRGDSGLYRRALLRTARIQCASLGHKLLRTKGTRA